MKDIRDGIQNPDKVLQLVREFIDEMDIRSEETVYQTDHVIENAYEFIADLCKAAGFAEGDEDDIHEDPFYDEENYGYDDD